MRRFLAEHLGVFDPNDTRVLVSAFDKAWEAVQASGVIFDKAKAVKRGARLNFTSALFPSRRRVYPTSADLKAPNSGKPEFGGEREQTECAARECSKNNRRS